MQIVVLASQKGGSGKTTLAGHLAVAAQDAGAGPVVLIDTDPQGSLTDWWNIRGSTTPLFAQATPSRLAAGIARIRDLGVGLIVIDTPPALAATMIDAVGLADLVIVPARPSPHDLRAAGATVAVIRRFGKPMTFVVNAATPRARITAEAFVALSQLGPVAPIALSQRTSYAASMIDGRTVMELPNEAHAAAEIAALWQHVAERLAEGASARAATMAQPCAA
jgi:chromosome partitioning protein